MKKPVDQKTTLKPLKAPASGKKKDAKGVGRAMTAGKNYLTR